MSFTALVAKYEITNRGLWLGLQRAGVILRGKVRGREHPNWKGGRAVKNGYVHVWIDPNDPMACMVPRSSKTYSVLEHRLVMARHLRRPLLSSEHVHHKNGIKHDNRLENLQLLSTHHPVGFAAVCSVCGSSDIRYQEVTIP